MNASEIMTTDVACCTVGAALSEVAQMMIDNDCGCIPVVEDMQSTRLVGLITDRDIVCRAVAKGVDVASTPASTCMTADPATARPETPIDECERIMRDMRVRRVPVVNENGACLGMISQADIALACGSQDAGQVVQAVSRPFLG